MRLTEKQIFALRTANPSVVQHKGGPIGTVRYLKSGIGNQTVWALRDRGLVEKSSFSTPVTPVWKLTELGIEERNKLV